MVNAITVRTVNKPDVLRKITNIIAKKDINIVYAHSITDSDDYASHIWNLKMLIIWIN